MLESFFTVFVNDEIIYNGIIYPYDYNSAAPPPLPYVINRDISTLDRSILEIGPSGFHGENDPRNDPRIINALNKSGLLVKGISFTINKVELYGNHYIDSISCDITIHNPDEINYYVLDSQKMGKHIITILTKV